MPARSVRLADAWENEIAHSWMNGPLNMARIILARGLGFEARIPALGALECNWRLGRPRLTEWFGKIATRPSFVATALAILDLQLLARDAPPER